MSKYKPYNPKKESILSTDEPLMLYHAGSVLGSFFKSFNFNPEDKFYMVRFAVEGIDSKLVLQFAKLVHLSVEKFTSFLDITRKTFDRKLSSNQSLSRSASEHSLSIFRLYWLGNKTFGSIDEFTGWLHSPNYHLMGALPVSYLNSMTGISILEDLLHSIQYGDAL